jgi:transcription antitermination factor NusA-like protein
MNFFIPVLPPLSSWIEVDGMKTPVCDLDVRAGELCPGCRKKLADGKITNLDFEVAQILYRINERYNISNASFYKALDLGNVVLVLTHGEVGLLIGKQGKVVSELSSALGKKVRIAQMTGDIKKTISDIIMPAQLLGLNKVFHGGQEVCKVRIVKSDLAHMPIDINTLNAVLQSLLEGEVRVDFE